MADEAAPGDVWVDSWSTIWYRPRATIRSIVDTDARKFVLGIAWFAGALAALNEEVMLATVDLSSTRMPHLPRLGPLGTAIFAFISGVISIITIYAGGSLFRWAGAILGGTATRVEVRAALAWAQVPTLYLTVVVIIAALLGLDLPTLSAPTSVFGAVESIIALWIFVILLKCVGEVHRFSAWRALGALLLGSLATFAVLAGLVLILYFIIKVGHPFS
jgi:hypothetical protein